MAIKLPDVHAKTDHRDGIGVRSWTRAIVIVLDGVGIGALPDAARYGDESSNTVGNIARHLPLRLPMLRALGLDRVVPLGEPLGFGEVTGGGSPRVPHAVGRMAEVSPGKDSVTGHWELMGVVLDRAFPVFPSGFPPTVIAEFSRLTGRGVLGNVAASGTAIIDELGAEHVRTGSLIVYTSADSVFQIAAHQEIVPIDELYGACEIAFELVCRGLGVGRVIARPFVGTAGSFKRTTGRRDYVLPPMGETLLDRLTDASRPVVAIGKIEDLFGGRGITRAIHTSSNNEGMDAVLREMRTVEGGLILANLVDFDTVYGHRNDIAGYAADLERFDQRLAELLPELASSDLLVVTADHGNDPTTPSSDHSREYVPILVTGAGVGYGIDLGTRRTFADVGQTLAEVFDIGPLAHGTSFLSEIVG
jgi:phosphopentomutase